MNPQLKVIIYEEKNILLNLLQLLDSQYEFLLSKNVIEIDQIAIEIDKVSKNLADIELKRRSFLKKEDEFKDIIENSNDLYIVNTYGEIKSILEKIQQQKEANELFIKQELMFTKKMIGIIKPSKNISTYNSYGQIKK